MNKQLIGLIVFFGIMLIFDACVLIFKRRWGRGLIATLICGALPIAVVTPNAILFPSYLLLNILYILIGVWFCFFVLIRSLSVQKNSILLKEKSVVGSAGVLFLFVVIYSLYNLLMLKSNTPLNFSLSLISYVLLSPFLEELLYRELVFKLIIGKSKKVMFFLFAICSLYGGLMHIPVRGFLISLFISFLFFVFYVIRYKFPKNSQFCFVFLLHSFYNIIVFIYSRVNGLLNLDMSGVWN